MQIRTFCALMLFALVVLPGCSGANTVMMQLVPLARAGAAGDPVQGEQIFRTSVDGVPPCTACHLTTVGSAGFSLAPNLAGIASRAVERIADMPAEAYIEDSIVHPAHYVVGGYHVSMYADYAAHLSPQDIANLVAYLMTL